jgi:hypothetical protein
MSIWRLASLTVLTALCGRILPAQTCPRYNTSQAAFVDQVLRADSVEVIFRSSAIAGDAVVSALLRLSKPEMRADSIPGAAQVSLAKLGDKTALEQLERELNTPKLSYIALDKLVRVGTDRAISILLVFFCAHVSDNSLHRRFGDYSYDLRLEIIDAISRRLQVGPIAPNGSFSVSFQDWIAWWSQNKEKPITLSISTEFRDLYLQCLARKVEWGFPDAVLDMANTRDPQAIAVLKHLATFGDQSGRSFNLKTLRGRAEFALARLGDEQELAAITRELDRAGYSGAIEELRLLGGKNAVAALISAFDSPDFLPEYKGFKTTYQREVTRRDQELANALAKMVISPPTTNITPESKKEWKDWWAKNKDTAQFITPPVHTYE